MYHWCRGCGGTNSGPHPSCSVLPPQGLCHSGPECMGQRLWRIHRRAQVSTTGALSPCLQMQRCPRVLMAGIQRVNIRDRLLPSFVHGGLQCRDSGRFGPAMGHFGALRAQITHWRVQRGRHSSLQLAHIQPCFTVSSLSVCWLSCSQHAAHAVYYSN